MGCGSSKPQRNKLPSSKQVDEQGISHALSGHGQQETHDAPPQQLASKPAAPDVQPQPHEEPAGPEAKVASREGSKTALPRKNSAELPRRTSSMQASKRNSLKKQPSGKEGRHGFVPVPKSDDTNSNSTSQLGSKIDSRVSDAGTKSMRPSDTGSRASRGSESGNRKRLSETGGKRTSESNGLFSAILAVFGQPTSDQPRRIASGNEDRKSPSGADEEEDDQVPDFQIDVVFIFKKALEVHKGLHLTPESLPMVIQTVLSALDSNHSGIITKGQLLEYVQSTCEKANMAVPNEQQVVQVFKDLNLAGRDSITRAELQHAFNNLHWFFDKQTI